MATKKVTFGGKDKETKEKVKLVCQECNSNKIASRANFYRCETFDTGYFPVCKKCFNSKYDVEVGLSIDEFKEICKKFNVPYIENKHKEIKKKNIVVKDKMRVLSDYLDFIYDDKFLKDIPYGDYRCIEDIYMKEHNDRVGEDVEEEVTEDVIRFWGAGLDLEEYKSKQEKLIRLCEQNGNSYERANDTQKNYYKQIIQLEELMETLITTDIKQYQEVLKTYTMVCDKCGINPKQIQDRQDNNQGSFGMFIKMIEDEEPIEDLGTFDSMKKMLELYFFGHLAEVTGNRNPLKAKYDAELEKYSVKVADFSDLLDLEEDYEEEEKKSFVKRVFKGGSKKRKIKIIREE